MNSNHLSSSPILALGLLCSLLGSSGDLPAQANGLGSAFFTLTNDARDNQVQVGARLHGQLRSLGRYSTGGAGTAAGLGSQGALAVSDNGRYLLAVNPGSNDVTLFRRANVVRLSRSDIARTGGLRPTSVDVKGDLVYALNADSDDVTGFRIRGGSLRPIGRFPLSGSGVGGAQVGFDPTGRHLVVTERASNQILVYRVRADGGLDRPTVNGSAAPTPFGFMFRRDGTLVVSEAAGGQAGRSAVSSYEIRADGRLRTISGGVATKQTAACWVALPRNGRFAYTANTPSGTITGLTIDRRGGLDVLNEDGVTGDLGPGATPIDVDFGRSGNVLFILDSGKDEIAAFYRDGRGGLHLLPGRLRLPDGAAGLVAR